MKKIKTRADAAAACTEVLNTEFFRALCEPARIEIFKELVLKGRSDIGTIAQAFPQDRSVIARHLQLMDRAGLLRSQTEGRHTYYELDGPALLARIEAIADLLRSVAPVCCAGE